jgi:hypothetical protein
VKYHFVYQKTSGETIFELDTDQQPPEPGETIRLRDASESQRQKQYIVDEVLISYKGQPNNMIIIEVEPIRNPRKRNSLASMQTE